MSEKETVTPQEQDVSQLLQIRRDKLAALQERGQDPFKITSYNQTHHSADIKADFDTLEGQTVSIAGRLMAKRIMGKASFCHVQDLKGSIQCYVARDAIGEEAYADFKKLDIGDIIGISGYVFKTKTGEISVHAESLTLLSKSLQILPEKYHGLTNVDMRYRQRYVDLIMNPEVKDTFIKRSKIISSIRRYLDAQGFMEVETPMLVSNAGGAAARPFETHFNALDEDVKLRISLELYLKRLIVGGLERVYEIGRVFRNEGVDTRHNPEFTLMELYQAYTDYHGMMDLTENLFRYLAQEVCGTTEITYGGKAIDLGKPFERLTMIDAVKKYAGIDFDAVRDTAEAKALADAHHIEYEPRHVIRQRQKRWLMHIISSMSRAMKRVTFSICSLKPIAKKISFSLPLLWITLSRFRLSPSANPISPVTLSVLSSSSTDGRCATLTPSSMIRLTSVSVSRHRMLQLQQGMPKPTTRMKTSSMLLKSVCLPQVASVTVLIGLPCS